MSLKQISLSMPNNLFEASKEYTERLGYRSVQEFILEIIRKKVLIENVERYKDIEDRMRTGKGVKKLNQKDAVNYINSL